MTNGGVGKHGDGPVRVSVSVKHACSMRGARAPRLCHNRLEMLIETQ